VAAARSLAEGFGNRGEGQHLVALFYHHLEDLGCGLDRVRSAGAGPERSKRSGCRRAVLWPANGARSVWPCCSSSSTCSPNLTARENIAGPCRLGGWGGGGCVARRQPTKGRPPMIFWNASGFSSRPMRLALGISRAVRGRQRVAIEAGAQHNPSVLCWG